MPIVYEDDWLLVVDKPAGMVVHPAPGHERGTLVQALLDRGIAGGHGRRPGVIHRLDRETSGLLIVARGEEPYRRLVAAMSARRISRTYLALLCGELAQDEGTIDAPIGRHLRDRRRMALHSVRARPAITHFTVLARSGGYTLARVRLETGRTHQIRVHFAALTHPVAGDATYGRRPVPEGLTRHFLHAAELRFAHPDDGRELHFTSPLPVGARGLPRAGRAAPALRLACPSCARAHSGWWACAQAWRPAGRRHGVPSATCLMHRRPHPAATRVERADAP